MSKQFARIAVTVSLLLFVMVAKASYCANNERIFHVYADPSFRILSNNEPSDMGFKDTCDNSSCFFHTCNDGELTVIIGTTDWSKYCTINIGVFKIFSQDNTYLDFYTCTLNGRDAGNKMTVTSVQGTGGNYYKFSING